MHETEKKTERLILISLVDSFEELEMLAQTAGADVVGYLSQDRERPHPGHYLGSGKVEELKAFVSEMDATGVLCDDELTSTQIKNLDKILAGPKILDRTMIILDIFAERASSAEGKAQVELAQLRYRLSRLAGLGIQLSRQGGGQAGEGGIGSRGPGEKKLETDRRHIQSRINQLKYELKEIAKGRAVLREKRLQTGIPVIALVGYTNAGKSTLMNALSGADVLAEDKLFATLDTTTRKIQLPGGTSVLLTDTVGFIDKLPHHLIQAFRATLEELQYATILLHVVDSSNPNYFDQMTVVKKTLQDLKCADKPTITVFNKADISEPGGDLHISAKTGENLSQLLLSCESTIQSLRQKISVLIPYSKGHIVSAIHKDCEILSEKHEETGTFIEAYAPEELCLKLEAYML